MKEASKQVRWTVVIASPVFNQNNTMNVMASSEHDAIEKTHQVHAEYVTGYNKFNTEVLSAEEYVFCTKQLDKDSK